eukprot:7384251-Prymnesium_polylepis.4
MRLWSAAAGMWNDSSSARRWKDSSAGTAGTATTRGSIRTAATTLAPGSKTISHLDDLGFRGEGAGGGLNPLAVGGVSATRDIKRPMSCGPSFRPRASSASSAARRSCFLDSRERGVSFARFEPVPLL